MTSDSTQYETIDANTLAPMSIEQRISVASSVEEVQKLLTFGNNARPSGATRRRWLRAAAQAYARIRVAKRNEEFPSVISEKSEKTEEKPEG